jgi:four helix bundle protein
MRDHTKLRAFALADELALQVYSKTAAFPREEQFGLTSQLRRGAVSIASNIVEGSARQSSAEYIRFLDMAYASACEVQYQLTLARRLGYLTRENADELDNAAKETCLVINGLLRALRKSSLPEA